MPIITPFKTKLVSREYLTDDMAIFRFTKPKDFDYKTGQFLQFLVGGGGTDDDGKPIRPVIRSYSIANRPEEDEFEFCIKILPDGFGTQKLAKMEIGEELEVRGPFGHFCCSEAKKQVFIATGSGIAPIKAMIEEELESGSADEISLLFGLRHKKEVFWHDKFTDIAKKNANFSYKLCLSREESIDEYSVNGRVTSLLDPSSLDLSARYYICGAPEMVKEVREILLDAGVEKGNIHLEIF